MEIGGPCVEAVLSEGGIARARVETARAGVENALPEGGIKRRPFFNQEPFLIELRPSWAPIFQSRTVLDAIMALLDPHFSIKNRP